MKSSIDIRIICKFSLKWATKRSVIYPLPDFELPVSVQNGMKTHWFLLFPIQGRNELRKDTQFLIFQFSFKSIDIYRVRLKYIQHNFNYSSSLEFRKIGFLHFAVRASNKET